MHYWEYFDCNFSCQDVPNNAMLLAVGRKNVVDRESRYEKCLEEGDNGLLSRVDEAMEYSHIS